MEIINGTKNLAVFFGGCEGGKFHKGGNVAECQPACPFALDCAA